MTKMEVGSGEEREYTEKATEDLLFKVLEKEFHEAMQDVLEDRRKITDPDVCNLFNLWYLRSHVNGLQREMREGFAGLRQEMDERFEKMDERFEKMDERFEKMDERFEKMEHKISLIFTFLGVGFTILAALITLFQFMG
jgi:tryptophanyl-tRNA synthetase